MGITNYEFKAKVSDSSFYEKKLQALNPVFKGEDHQKDTYFMVPAGRLKLREGNIENALIYYERSNTANAKRSDILLYRYNADKALKEILQKLYGVKVVVDKIRRIYFIENVKFHFDTVKNLGAFIEVEAIDDNGSVGMEKLQQQCSHYARYFGIKESDYCSQSYSDMIKQK